MAKMLFMQLSAVLQKVRWYVKKILCIPVEKELKQ